MSKDLELATVEHIRRDKGYGFARTDDGVRVFFHANRRARAQWHPGFDRDTCLQKVVIGMKLSNSTKTLDDVEEGSRIRFVGKNARKGFEAYLWVNERHWPSQYADELAKVDALRCRVFGVVRWIHQNQRCEYVDLLFSGTIGELRQKYPHHMRDGFEDGLEFSFEYYLWDTRGNQDGEGEMLACLDPRPLP